MQMKVKCSDCEHLKYHWCNKAMDSPHEQMPRYCEDFSQKENPDSLEQMHKLSNEIYDKLGRGELLCQLSEEASELAKAALKLRRASGLTNNPTPVSAEDAYDNLIEEIADVRLCLIMLGLDGEPTESKIKEIEDYKLKRWHSRLFSEEP